MSIKINGDFMAVETGGSVIAAATRISGERWALDSWPGHFSRARTLTALVLAGRRAAGYGDDDPFVIGWREELR